MQQDPMIGKQLGTYRIQGKLGEGGMARVYKAYQTRLRRDVAIKVITAQVIHQDDFTDQATLRDNFKARFEREAQLIASLEHPNIVAVYDYGEEQEITYLVMQYVGGGTLREQLHQGQPLNPQRTAHYALQMARALHHAHLRGIVHRDVKPQNMLVSANDPNQLLLSDFGIAKLFYHDQDILRQNAPTRLSAHSLTNADQIVGTVEYMAPEQALGQPVDARTDVYALGVVLYQMLTGSTPFQSTTAIGLMYHHVHTAPLSASQVNPQAPEALVQITERALQKKPDHRFQSAEAMAQALEAAISSISNPHTLSARSTAFTQLPTVQGNTYPQGQISTQNPSSFGQTPAPFGNTPAPSGPTPTPLGQPLAAQISGSGPMYPNKTGTKVRPNGTRARKVFSLTNILTVILILATSALLITKILPMFGITFPPQQGTTGGTGNTTHAGAPFTEDFSTNDRHWDLTGTGFSATTDPHQYAITSTDGNTHFPHPDPAGTATGPLPQNFTLKIDITATTADPTIYYGLAFRLREDASGVSSYVFAINRQGKYAIFKYKANNQSTMATGSFQGIQTKLNTYNTLQVTVKDHTFSFQINNQPVLVGSSNTVSDTSLTGGQPGIFVTGASTHFIVKSVQLAVP